MGQQSLSFKTRITRTVHLDYLLYLPDGYSKESGRRWPLILFLHGAGERGDDLEQVKLHGIPKIVENQPDFPFIAVSPQCPVNTSWYDHVEALDRLLKQVIADYAVDLHRVYLTGLSMGGFGSWRLGVLWPERFAAIAPICGGGFWGYNFPERVRVLKNTPVWVFHGAKDPVVPVEESRRLVEILKSCGGSVRYTEYPEAGHDSWTETYDNPELYEWFLSHTR